jgi:hypothetical protein
MVTQDSGGIKRDQAGAAVRSTLSENKRGPNNSALSRALVRKVQTF